MKIGFIGLGIMGESMAANIVSKHDDPVFVSDLNRAQVEKLAAAGAIACDNNTQAAEQADVIVSFAHIQLRSAKDWTGSLGRKEDIWHETNVIGVTEGIYNDAVCV